MHVQYVFNFYTGQIAQILDSPVQCTLPDIWQPYLTVIMACRTEEARRASSTRQTFVCRVEQVLILTSSSH